jgi:hypothetical protein
VTCAPEPSTRGVLTRFRKRPRAGGGSCVPSGPRGRFQPAPVAPVPFAARLSSRCFREPVRIRREGGPKARPALPARSPPPLVRSPAERPPPRRGEDNYGGGFGSDASILAALVGGGWKALNWLEWAAANARTRPGIGAPLVKKPRHPATCSRDPWFSFRVRAPTFSARAADKWVPRMKRGMTDVFDGVKAFSPRRSPPYISRRDNRRAVRVAQGRLRRRGAAARRAVLDQPGQPCTLQPPRDVRLAATWRSAFDPSRTRGETLSLREREGPKRSLGG